MTDLNQDLAAAEAALAAIKCQRDNYRRFEGVSYSSFDYQIDDAVSLVVRLRREIALAAWTLEIITERRAAWNTWARAASKDGRVTPDQINRREEAQGWTTSDLKSAMLRHGIM